tara:strand:- start:101 stop:256 length:156 start_codon:yes stop_codon:yes gene_type:complete
MKKITLKMTYLDGRIENQSVPVACSAEELINMLMDTVPMIRHIELIKEESL